MKINVYKDFEDLEPHHGRKVTKRTLLKVLEKGLYEKIMIDMILTDEYMWDSVLDFQRGREVLNVKKLIEEIKTGWTRPYCLALYYPEKHAIEVSWYRYQYYTIYLKPEVEVIEKLRKRNNKNNIIKARVENPRLRRR